MSYDVELHGGVLALDPEWDAALQSGFVGFP
jgi:hypothetical protein